MNTKNPQLSRFGYGPGSPSAKARARRMEEFERRFLTLAALSVIDLGGVPSFWTHGVRHPRRVTCVNLDPLITVPAEDGGLDPQLDWITCVRADAIQFDAEAADLVVSNSLIEHLGGVGPRSAFADTVKRLGRGYWVQTPYRYFPIEPHWMFPGMQFLPLKARQVVARRHWGVGTTYERDFATRAAAWTELIGITEMEQLFPEGEIWRERTAGLTKSIVAIRQVPDQATPRP